MGERRMPVKFSYDTQVGLRVETDFDSELTREEAMVVAVRDLASGMHSLSQAVWELYDEFRFKESSKRDEPSPAAISPAPAPAKTPSAPARSKKASAPARKKTPPARSKKRRK
jgi:hypothetical protein